MNPAFIVVLGTILLTATPAAAQTIMTTPANPAGLAPPVAKRTPVVLREHGRERIDDYPWFRDRNNPDTLAYLQAENAYAAQRLARLSPLIDEIARELRARTDGANANLDFVDASYVYERQIVPGARHPAIVRRPLAGGPQETVLDIERLAEGHDNYSLDNYAVSPDGNIVAFAVDPRGDLRHNLYLRDIRTGALTDPGIGEAAAALAFSADSRHLFYIRLQKDTLRSYQLWRHRLGTPAADDRLVYEETDPTFELRLRTTKSGRYLLLTSWQQQATEVRYLRADDPLAPFIVMEPRRPGHVHDADHAGGQFFIRTNADAPDFRVVTAPEAAPRMAHWQDFVAHTPGRIVARMEAFDDFVALVEEHDAVQSVRLVRRADRREIAIPAPAALGVTDISFWWNVTNRDPAAKVLHVRFTSPLHPPSLYDVDLATGALTLRWRSPTTRWFNAEAYEVRRIAATAPDGESVPATLVWRRDAFRPGANPALIVGYGAYGFSMLPRFHGDWISLVDRGFVYVYAHVRGGKEKGRRWHDAGRVLDKRNTFTDFIAVTQALAAQGYAHPRRIFARGGSAGGLLMGALANMRPDLYAGLVAEVPFVDVISTASDPALPTSTLEYQEWGDPALPAHYDYMRAYSPYDNVMAQGYPPLLVTTARYDSQVGFHEPAKWVARLRARKTDGNELLLLTNMIAGHSGIAGRFGSIEENAQIMAWLIAHAARE